MKELTKPSIGDRRILKQDIGSLAKVFEKGDEVKIIAIGERGYDLKQGDSVMCECGWDIFESKK
ncbi:hypothetical protein Goe26_00170 [Bacillus phage vB_BsuM-Goe26]|nr:hypothetical protein Goe26_00170 [Bacillus phage vB_BsuM-Goe26]